MVGQEETLAYYLHQAYDRVNKRLMTTTWSGPSAQDRILTAQAVFANVYDPTCQCFRTSGTTGTVTALPAPCVVGAQTILLPQAETYLCIEEDPLDPNDTRCGGDSPCWLLLENTTPAPAANIVADTLRLRPLAQTETCVLTNASVNTITPATDGSTVCPLPSAADEGNPGFYRIVNATASALTLTTSGDDVIHPGPVTTLGPIFGPSTSFLCYVESASSWNCSAMTDAGYGDPITMACTGTDSNVNTSTVATNTNVLHDLSCSLPANTIQEGTTIEACMLWQVISGSTAAGLRIGLYANDTKLNENATHKTPQANLTRQQEMCQTIVVGEETTPGNGIRKFYTGPIGVMENWGASTGTGSVAQPVNVNVTVPVAIFWKSSWAIAGVGTNSIQGLHFTVKTSKLRRY